MTAVLLASPAHAGSSSFTHDPSAPPRPSLQTHSPPSPRNSLQTQPRTSIQLRPQRSSNGQTTLPTHVNIPYDTLRDLIISDVELWLVEQWVPMDEETDFSLANFDVRKHSTLSPPPPKSLGTYSLPSDRKAQPATHAHPRDPHPRTQTANSNPNGTTKSTLATSTKTSTACAYSPTCSKACHTWHATRGGGCAKASARTRTASAPPASSSCGCSSSHRRLAPSSCRDSNPWLSWRRGRSPNRSFLRPCSRAFLPLCPC